MPIRKYLEKLQQDESIFPMDSVHTKRKFLRTWTTDKREMNEENAIVEQPRIMVDFDGVLHKYDSWNDGILNKEAIDGSREALDTLHKQGYEIVIFTTRASKLSNSDPSSDELIMRVKQWLKEHNIYYDKITAEKLPAVAYIDDKAIRFEGVWSEVLQKLEEITNG